MAEARADAGRAIRDFGHALVGHHTPIELLDEVTRTLDGLTRQLDESAVRSRSEVPRDGRFGEPPPDGSIMTADDERPVSARASPWWLDTEVRRAGDAAVASLTLRAAHEGAPERSHGGIVAALFDDVFGFVLHIQAQSAFTGELWMHYEAGVPIGEPLTCPGQVPARSAATFIAIDQFVPPSCS